MGKVMGDMMDKKDNPKEDIKLYLYSAVSVATAFSYCMSRHECEDYVTACM